MKIILLSPRRKVVTCDLCSSSERVRECFLPYTPKSRTDLRGSGKFYDLCEECRGKVDGDPRPHAPQGDLPAEWWVRRNGGVDWSSGTEKRGLATSAPSGAG